MSSYNWRLLSRYRKGPSKLLQSSTKHKDLVVPQKEASALESLPAEVLNIIAQFLTVQDLISCSITCTRLRSVFNDNLIWRKFCKQNITRYFENNEQRVDADFDLSSLTYDLDPICDQRLLYIKQNQLLNNWKNGKFTEHKINSSSGLYYMCLKSGTTIIYEDVYLFLYDFHAHTIVVWDIQDTPFPYTNIRLLYYNYFYEDLHYEIVGKKLVVYELGKLILIYDINLPDRTIPLVRIIIVDENEPLRKIPEFNNPEEVYSLCYHKVIGNKIYSHKVGKPLLHIWDVEKGRKVQALSPPIKGCGFDVLSAANNGNDLILCLEINDPDRNYNPFGKVYEVFSYSFSTEFFKTIWTNKEPSSVTYIPFHAIQHEYLVIVFCRLNNFFIDDNSLSKTILFFYDYKWGMITGEKSFPELFCHRQMKVVDNKLFLATAFCIYAMDINTQDIVHSFKFDGGKLELLNVFDGKFIVTTPRSLVSVTKTKRKEIWDVKNRRKCVNIAYMLTSAYSKDSVFVNQSYSKMIVVGKGTLGVLNFW